MQLVYTWWRDAKTLGYPQHALKRSDLTGHQQLNPKVHASSSFHLVGPFEDIISGCYTRHVRILSTVELERETKACTGASNVGL